MTSLVGVNIVELIEEMEGRGRVLAGFGMGDTQGCYGFNFR